MFFSYFRLFAIGGISLAAFLYLLPMVSVWLSVQFPESWLSSEDTAMLLTAIPTFLVLPAILIMIWKDNTEYPPELRDIELPPNDPELLVCTEKAHAEIHRFIDSLQKNNREMHVVRYSKDTSNFSFQNVWFEVDSFENGQLNVKPLPEDKNSDFKVIKSIAMEEIEDWGYTTRKGLAGSYTHLALYKAYLKKYGKFPSLYNDMLNSFIDINFMNLSFVSRNNKKKKYF